MLDRILYRLFGKLPKSNLIEFLKPYKRNEAQDFRRKLITHHIKTATL